MAQQTTKILVVDDEKDVTDLVAHHLRAKGWEVETLNDSTLILAVAREFLPDLMILDITMPEIGGLQICLLFKSDPVFREVPIVLLTARAREEDRVSGFEAGADDYVCKPFSPRELVLRVNCLLKRRREETREPGAQHQLAAGPIVLDEERHEVTVDGESVELTTTEFRLLKLLLERRGRVQTRKQLLINVWSYDKEIDTRTVDTHVMRLRDKLRSAAKLIETVRGVGYRIATDRTL